MWQVYYIVGAGRWMVILQSPRGLTSWKFWCYQLLTSSPCENGTGLWKRKFTRRTLNELSSCFLAWKTSWLFFVFFFLGGGLGGRFVSFWLLPWYSDLFQTSRQFYALPQSPQTFKQLLMVGSLSDLSRYQVARSSNKTDLHMWPTAFLYVIGVHFKDL